MSHKPILFKNVALSFPHKSCFEDFTASVLPFSRIAIIGANGCGKSSLIKIMLKEIQATSGEVVVPSDAAIGYVPQVIEDFDSLSGGERLNKRLSAALSMQPNVLLLDEPTNHLDVRNRKSLIRMLESFSGTLFAVTHDVELLNAVIDTIWHIDSGKIHIFSGSYTDYMRQIQIKRRALEEELSQLKRQKKEMHGALMKEQERASKSRAKGEKSIDQRKWPTIVSKSKANRASETTGRKKREIAEKKDELVQRLSELRVPEVIKPKFSFQATETQNRVLVAISDAFLGYVGEKDALLSNIHLSLTGAERIAIKGENGSGKSTLMKAMLHDPNILKSGHWSLPPRQDIGYLDQHYATLLPHHTVLESIKNLVPTWTIEECRRHLRDFLFRKNEEVNALVSTLSGGEKARLSLAHIAAKTPKLLLLDEITNNLDLETLEHVTQVLLEYPGAMIVISHDEKFLQAINIKECFLI